MKRLLILAALVAVAIAACVGPDYVTRKHRAEAASARLQKAEAMFAERCKKAGEKIYRTVENVEGIYLLKLRPEDINYAHQFRMDDPYGRDIGGDGYIESLVQGSWQANTRGTPAPGSPPRIGYRYVEAVDPADGKRYRYTGSVKVVGQQDRNAPNVRLALERNPKEDTNIYAFVVDKVPAPGEAPRYGVTYDDLSTREEREYWIAGSSLRVIDLKTNEVIAERVGYMMDRGQGSGISPWLMAADDACPTFQSNPNLPVPRGQGFAAQANQTLDFVEKVLHPKVGG